MKIELSKEQYKNLITMVALSGGVFSILWDMSPNRSYKKISNRMDELEKHLLTYTKNFKIDQLTELFENELMLNENFYQNKILPILTDYEEFSLYDGLANELAWRDFRNDHTEAEMEKIAKEHGGYVGVAMYDYEKKYWDEFDKYGYERLKITNSK